MIDRALDAISFADIEDLVRFGRSEGRTLDFKAEMPDGGHKGTRDFLADVTAFANSEGGDLVLGVAEDGNGVAVAIPGIDRAGLDERLRGLDGQLASCVDPRIPDFRIGQVDCPDGKVVVVLRVGASLIAPHRVAYDKSSRFYRRANRGNFEMSTAEIRRAFAASDDMPRKLRDLHLAAVEATGGDQMPIRLLDRPAIILTIAPLSVLREQRNIAVTRENAIIPPRALRPHFVIAFDGVIVHAPVEAAQRGSRAWSINQRRGYADFVWTIGEDKDGFKTIWPANIEDHLAGIARSTIARLMTHGLTGPWVAMASLIGLEGYRLYLGYDDYSEPAWQDRAYLGEVIDDTLGEACFEPFILGFWRLFGRERDDP